ncbi:MAG: NADH-quinone oxidoreductase subunit D [Acidobacteriota bacterium]|nr:NADH-quinone oxidoreductase subunit D [Acidobacteriota bacterium]MDE2963463.1 NADH-quinone oxidoreductase subunit D [Acidobacteriota bacterium]
MQVEAYAGEEMVLNMGPQHPSTHGVLRLELETDGEIVRNVIPHIGYLHRCFEKHAENIDYPGVIPFCDRMDYIASMNNSLGYALAVEKLMGLEVNERVKTLRVLMAELNRIASHLLSIGTYAMDIGSFTPFLHCFREREKVLDLFEWLCGARLLYNYNWVGGVSHDIPEGFEAKTREFMTQFEPVIAELDKLLSYNKIFLERTADVGIISEEQALSHNVTGPNLRGSGIAWDLRKEEPYCGYETYEFEVPVGLGEHGPLGSCWDRYYVRVREMEQCLGLIRQALDRLPEGDVHEHIPRRVRPAKGEVYDRTETPRGELGYYIVSDGVLTPFRVKVKSPCFTVLSLLPAIAKGGMVADIIAIIGSIDIVMGEIDR